MLRMARCILAVAVVAALAGCAAGGAGTTPTAERLDRLEAQMKSTQTYDMRIAHLEDRLTLLEQDIGRVRAGGAAPRKVEPTPKSAAPKPVPKPVSAAPAPAQAAPVAAAPVSEKAHEVAPPPMLSSEKTPEAAPSPTAGTSAASEPVRAALADLSGAGAPQSDYYVGGRRVAPPQAGAAASPAAPSVVAPTSAKAGASGQAAYNAALALFENKQYNEAKVAFEAFIAANPQSSLRPNAQYWVGECLYSKGDYSGAILNFTDVAGNYPKHPKAAAALLKAGYAYAAIGDQDNARFYWQMLRNDFPKSSEARMAAKRMGADQ